MCFPYTLALGKVYTNILNKIIKVLSLFWNNRFTSQSITEITVNICGYYHINIDITGIKFNVFNIIISCTVSMYMYAYVWACMEWAVY